jgi:hypothetical protein
MIRATIWGLRWTWWGAYDHICGYKSASVMGDIVKPVSVPLFVLLVSCGAIGCNKRGPAGMDQVANQVANDSVKEYDIAARQGDKMQICVQAGMVSAAYLQAHDEPNYNKWKSIEKSDCVAAGLPRE